MQPIPEATQAERLTSTLRQPACLNYGGAAGDAPRSVIYKTSHPDRVGDALCAIAGRQEVAFYDQIAPMMAAANLVPRCFQAHRDAETNV